MQTFFKNSVFWFLTPRKTIITFCNNYKNKEIKIIHLPYVHNGAHASLMATECKRSFDPGARPVGDSIQNPGALLEANALVRPELLARPSQLNVTPYFFCTFKDTQSLHYDSTVFHTQHDVTENKGKCTIGKHRNQGKARAINTLPQHSKAARSVCEFVLKQSRDPISIIQRKWIQRRAPTRCKVQLSRNCTLTRKNHNAQQGFCISTSRKKCGVCAKIKHTTTTQWLLAERGSQHLLFWEKRIPHTDETKSISWHYKKSSLCIEYCSEIMKNYKDVKKCLVYNSMVAWSTLLPGEIC